ncbi:uncharacterized protein LOC114948063 [Acropora millepora]|uniref:uncharacterized protein LOC114948063 n=1 Tax=Acropora millepora TaxID=45264 RepID=UPI001CF216F3|nr:uncharacterized protein LOC114948063 [Acropora millepora]
MTKDAHVERFPRYETIGCFRDIHSRAIPKLEGKDAILDGHYRARQNAVEKCYQAAKKRNFSVFAVQHGGWCASSATAYLTFDTYGSFTACKPDGEGGPWANQVYYITGYRATGCYSDSALASIPFLEVTDSILDGPYRSRTNPIAKCAVAAMRKNFNIFAVQDGRCAASATASQTFDVRGKSDACLCEREGGSLANQIYSLEI